MGKIRMFLAQKRINEVIIYTILIDVVLAYILKKLYGNAMSAPLVLLYLLNIIALIGVYRFWKYPVFECNEKAFIFYGISPFKKDAGFWENVEKAGFEMVEAKKGRKREHLVVVYTNAKGLKRTGIVPMDLVGFSGDVKKELLDIFRKNSIKGL